MTAEVALEIPAADYAHLTGEPRNDFMFTKRCEVVLELQKAVEATGTTYQHGKVHLMAAENNTRTLFIASHP